MTGTISTCLNNFWIVNTFCYVGLKFVFSIMHQQISTRECGLLQWAAVLWNTTHWGKRHLSLSQSIIWEEALPDISFKQSFHLQWRGMNKNEKTVRGRQEPIFTHFLCFLYTAQKNSFLKIIFFGASLVAQWLGVCLPIQRTRVQALVWEDPTCRGATGPVSHNYWACASGACAPQRERPR